MWYLISFSILSQFVPIFHVSLSIIFVLFKYLKELIELIFILPYYFYLVHVYYFI